MAMRKKDTKELVIPPQKVTVAKIDLQQLNDSCLVVHNFSEKSRKDIEKAQQKEAKGPKAARDPMAEYEAAKHIDEKGRQCVRADALRCAIIDAASFVDGVTKVKIRGAIFVRAQGHSKEGYPLLPLTYKKEYMRDDVIRLPNGSADMRYRPCYVDWELKNVEVEYDPDIFSAEQVHHLVQRAGFAIGLHEHRPQKGGEWGRFEIATTNRKKAA